MSGEWKPGDVAIVSNPDSVADGQLAMRAVGDGDRREAWVVGKRTWLSMSFAAKELRPVVVIDPEDRKQVERLLHAEAREHGEDESVIRPEHVSAAQAALRSLVAPPKPPEPQGLGAVVEDADGELWLRWEIPNRHPLPWTVAGSMRPNRGWHQIAAVKVLSEGIPS